MDVDFYGIDTHEVNRIETWQLPMPPRKGELITFYSGAIGRVEQISYVRAKSPIQAIAQVGVSYVKG